MRTKNSLKNIISVVVFNLIIGILGFIRVRVFIDGLSNDIYSLNQLFYQIFSYITIADIGFGLILSKGLYQAFAKEDKDEVNNIYSTSKKFYKIIGLIMIAASVLISFFVHYLTKAEVSRWYIQLVCIIFLVRNVIDYFFIAPRYVIEADQKNYKINHYIKSIKIIETIVEIVLVLLGCDYIIVLLPGLLITILIDLYVNHLVYKEYPWLHDNKKYNKKYLKGTKDLIYLRLAGLMNSNTDIILISTFINPLNVVIYTSYSYITKFISDTIYIMANAIIPSYANVINKEDTEKSYGVFNELNILFLFIASFVFIMLFKLLDPFIVLWVGADYLTNIHGLVLFCIIAFYNISVRPLVIIINSKGLFKETKIITICEGLLNLILSCVLIFKLGLIGVLLGTVIASYTTTFIQNSYYIYKNIFKKNVINYYGKYLIAVIIMVACTIGVYMIPLEINSFTSWFIYAIIIAIGLLIVLAIIYYILFKAFRALVNRGIEFIKVRGNYN